MRKRLTRKRLVMLVLAGLLVLGLSATVANGAVWTDHDTKTIHGTTGEAKLLVSTATLSFKDLQPGERLATYWWIKNVGPCPLKITVGTVVNGPGWIVATFHPGYTLFLGPGQRMQVALTVEMLANAPDSTAGKNFHVHVAFTSKEDSNHQDSIPPTGIY